MGAQRQADADDHLGPVIRLMSDYLCGVPLWGRTGCLNGPEPEPPMSSQLHADLIAWQDDFDRHFDHQRGWEAPSCAVAYAAAGRRLLERLRTELPDHEVVLDLWPVPTGLQHSQR